MDSVRGSDLTFNYVNIICELLLQSQCFPSLSLPYYYRQAPVLVTVFIAASSLARRFKSPLYSVCSPPGTLPDSPFGGISFQALPHPDQWDTLWLERAKQLTAKDLLLLFR